MKRLVLSVLLCAAAARAEIKERIAAVVNGQPILLSDVEERVGPELTRVMQQVPGADRDKDRAGLLHRGGQWLASEPAALRAPDQHGRLLAVGHEFRLSSLWGRMKEMIDAGAIGEPKYLLIELWRRPYRLGAD